ncbi:MAG: DUF115 domain-containing protein [Treponema sp.]|jgi:hypothetical protein|nr:DUF115 domain-containing protein [Treponema sp.]
MNYWESNLTVLREKHPGLAEQLEAGTSGSGGAVRVETAASGDPTLTVGTLRIHSKRDPLREGTRLAEALEEGTGPIAVLGFGLGYAAEAAGQRFPDRPLIIIEYRREILRKALESRDLGSFLSERKLVFILGEGSPSGTGKTRPDAVITALRLFGGKPVPLRNRALTSLDEAWYAEAERHIQTWVSKDEVNRATLRRFGKRWVRNLAANMEAIRNAPGISALSDCLSGTGIPALLVAAGPSLNLAAPFLRDMAERCVVVAVDTSLRFLLQRGVDPDFALVVDPQYWNFRHLDRVKAPHTCLITESAVYPPALRCPFREKLLCGSLFPLGRFIEDRVDPKGELGAGGSVATTAWDFARVLGTGAVWIAGLDLAFPDLKTHFKGALFEERSLAESTRFAPAETRSVHALRDGLPFRASAARGGEVLTDRRLSLYAAWFENRFSLSPAFRNYSLSPGGLAIPGLIPAAPEDLLALPPRRDEIRRTLEAAFSRLERDFRGPEQTAARSARYDAARAALLTGLERIAAVSGEAAILAEQTLETAGRGAEKTSKTGERAERNIQQVLNKLDEATRFITASEVKDAAGFLFPPIGELEKNLTETDPLARHLELSAKLYRALAEAAKYNLTVLSDFGLLR